MCYADTHRVDTILELQETNAFNVKLKRFKKQYSTMVVIIFHTLAYNVSLVHAQHLNICDVIIETDG